jgi:hypothetical protein
MEADAPDAGDLGCNVVLSRILSIGRHDLRLERIRVAFANRRS